MSFLSVVITAQYIEKEIRFSEYSENYNIKKNAQCVHTIALVCSPKIGNNWKPWKPINKLTKTWERFNAMGAMIYSWEFTGSLFE